jgi:type IV pilus assembly protein PilC
MANYNYEGIDARGAKVSGSLAAANEKEARKMLSAKRIRVRKVVGQSGSFDLEKWIAGGGLAASFGAKQLLTFTKQLSVMINAGVPIMQSLEIMQRSEVHPAMKKAIAAIATQIGEGKTIAEAMSTQKGFDKLYINLVKAGEAGGVLDEILNKLALHMEKQAKLKSQIKAALMYPAIVVTVGVAVVWGMMVFVIPIFVGMLKENNTKIPAITQFVIDLSKFFTAYTLYMVPGIALAIYAFKYFISTPDGKLFWDKTTMRVPLFGGVIIKGSLATFASTLGTLLTSGISLLEALEISTEAIDNVVIANDIKEVRKKIMEGQTLTEPLSNIKYFPELVVQMVRVGEQTGQIDTMLVRVAKVFEDELETLIGTMTKMVEPIIIVVLGGCVGTMLIAMYLPMFQAAG